MIRFQQASFLASYGVSSQLPASDRLEFVFAGRSNVGKSSLINKLFYRKSLAKVSSVPGKTATINFYAVDQIHFVDLPGYGYAKVSKADKVRWGQLIEKYFQHPRTIGFVVQLIDLRHPPTKLDLEMVEYLITCELPFVVALTKADKLNKTQTAERLASIRSELPCGDQITLVPCSVTANTGMDELRTLIEDAYLDWTAEVANVAEFVGGCLPPQALQAKPDPPSQR